MSILNSLNAVEAERPTGYDPVRSRRRKLAQAIDVQIQQIAADHAGVPYRRSVLKRHRDLETDLLIEVQEQRRVVRWWWHDEQGKVNFQLRYGAAVLEVSSGKSVFQAVDLDEARNFLGELRKATLSGELDGALTIAASALRGRFSTKRKARS